MIKIVLLCSSLFIFLWGCTSHDTLTQASQSEIQEFCKGNPKRIAVIGATSQIKGTEWENHLIAHGISNILSQALCDTGNFVLVESNSEVQEKLQQMIDSHWTERKAYSEQEADSIAKDLGCDAVAYAKVKSFSTNRARLVGPFAGATTTVVVEVEVNLKPCGKSTWQSVGVGKAKTNTVGMLFQVNQGKIYFDDTNVGKATKQALLNAVDALPIPTKNT